jgi:diaminohydroxyphosphoribosylaminopyrimidine deaminase/5-amino-6-(5-phosphoribosylamino)uracil reductase
VLFQGPEAIGEGGIASPSTLTIFPAGFRKLRGHALRRRRYAEWIRDFGHDPEKWEPVSDEIMVNVRD